MGLVASLWHWDAGSIPSHAQWVKDLVLPQLQHRLQLWLASDPWPGNSICLRTAKKKKKVVIIATWIWSPAEASSCWWLKWQVEIDEGRGRIF